MAPPTHSDLHPAGILSRWIGWTGSAKWRQTASPTPLGPSEKYLPPFHMGPIDGSTRSHLLRPFQQGAADYGTVGGLISYNPIGAGIVNTQGLPVLPDATARILNNVGIYWHAQMVNKGRQPNLGPLYSPSAMRALLGLNAAQAVVPPAIPSDGFYPGG